MFVITRESSDGAPPRRVFVTGPHFGHDIFSSTENKAEASRYTEERARELVAERSWSNPEIEPA